METKETALLFDFGATRNSLNTSVLIVFRVAVCSTLKTVKSLILNALQGAPSVSSLKKFTEKSKLLWKLNAIGRCGAPREKCCASTSRVCL